MFGYIRPEKGELLIREFSRFRCVYCGICKEIKKSYGNIPRITLTYDMTFLALLELSLSENDGINQMEGCILNPFKKKPVLSSHDALKRGAALSVIFTMLKMKDDLQDSKEIFSKIRQRIGILLFSKNYRRASKEYPNQAKIILDGLSKLSYLESHENEGGNAYDDASDIFGEIIAGVFKESFSHCFENESNRELFVDAMEKFGFYLGKWIYITDAIDDYKKDQSKKQWNPFNKYSYEEAKGVGVSILEECEQKLDIIAALLPYKRDGNIVRNVLQKGLMDVRSKIFEGKRLGKL